MRTRLSICLKKQSFRTEAEAELAIADAQIPVRLYRCERCRLVHLTSRTKGKRTVRPSQTHGAEP